MCGTQLTPYHSEVFHPCVGISIVNGRVSRYTDGLNRGSTAQVECIAGYDLTIDSSAVMVCGEGPSPTFDESTRIWVVKGLWRRVDGQPALIPPQCVQRPWCDKLLVRNAAAVVPRDAQQVGETVKITCLEGYQLNFDQEPGVRMAQCTENTKFLISGTGTTGMSMEERMHITCLPIPNWCRLVPNFGDAAVGSARRLGSGIAGVASGASSWYHDAPPRADDASPDGPFSLLELEDAAQTASIIFDAEQQEGAAGAAALRHLGHLATTNNTTNETFASCPQLGAVENGYRAYASTEHHALALIRYQKQVNPGYRGGQGATRATGDFSGGKNAMVRCNPGYRGLFRTNQRLIRCNPGYLPSSTYPSFPKDFG